MYTSKTYIAVPPGETIKEQVSDRGMTQKEFSERMNLSQKHVSQLINGKVQLTNDIAIRLEAVLGIPAEFWTNLENKYRLMLAKVEDENGMEEDEDIARAMPYSEAAEFGWLKKNRSIKEKVKELRIFFKVAKLTSLQNIETAGVSYRKLANTENAEYAKLIWVQQVKNIAESTEVEDINVHKLRDNMDKIRTMTLQKPNDYYAELVEMLSQCGIVLVVLPHLSGSYMHGATFITNNRIALGLTIRRKDADIFWFSLFHELFHILNGDIYGDVDEEKELLVDNMAKDYLIPPEDYRNFIEIGNFNREKISEFSKRLGIDPGIVVGRLQKENHILYSQFNELKKKYELVNNNSQ